MDKVKITGYLLVLFGIIVLINIFSPLLKNEIYYLIKSSNHNYTVKIDHSDDNHNSSDDMDENSSETIEIIPVDKHFSVIIPKLGANARVIENVDPFNSSEYQNKLTKGVAHSKTSSLPNEDGNTFLFAHSSDNFYNANRYNSIFYLLNKLENNDVFYIVYDGELQKYQVNSKNVVNNDDVQYLYPYSQEKTTTLMTCWPPGTTLKRLIVEGKLIEN